MKRLKDFDVTDLNALAAFNPHLVKLVPNTTAIRQALKLGFKLPGVQAQKSKQKPLDLKEE